MNLKELKNCTILLFGKTRAFSLEEFEAQMKFHAINFVRELSDEVVLSVDGRMMSPYEQKESEILYEEKKIPSINIDVLEKELAGFLDNDVLLMSLKLSHDKERLKSFLLNPMISDDFFFKLIKMYDWSGEDFFENDDNRDVSAAFISRFYENIERNHNVQYATTGYIHLVAQTTNEKLLEAIATLQPLKYHPKIKAAIAMNALCGKEMQKKFYKSGDEKILEALSYNVKLDEEIIEEFLKDGVLGDNVASSITLNEELFEKLQVKMTSLAKNESLTLDMQEKLLALQDKSVNLFLARNDNIDEKTITTLLKNANTLVELALYENNSTPQNLLIEAYENPANHEALAKNENTPVEILYQLQLDGRYERFVKTNAGYGKHIQVENIGWLV